jgi:hypothetical protein
MNNQKNIPFTLILGLLVTISCTFAVGYSYGLDTANAHRDTEMKQYHKNYLIVHPFEGDITYTDFDMIFGRQDDEFYQIYK